MQPSTQPTILVVDDDDSIRQGLRAYLERHAYQVLEAANAMQMDLAIAASAVDLLVLDVMLPGEDGFSICKRLSNSGIPILMLSALSETTDRVVGLEIGADDYLAKPFEPRELLARIRAMLRRQERKENTAEAALVFAGWKLLPLARTLLSPQGFPVTLTASEFALLHALVQRPCRILSRDTLLNLVSGHDAEIYDRAIDLQISRLRKKLAQADEHELIQTVRGEGYRFAAEVRRT